MATIHPAATITAISKTIFFILQSYAKISFIQLFIVHLCPPVIQRVRMIDKINVMEKGIVCLNCGATCSGAYCHQCGQPTQTPQRLNNKTLGKSMVMSFARLTPGFWVTFVGLIVHPWVVVREYLQGKRVKYSPPITMVIQLVLYFTLFYTMVENIVGVDADGTTLTENNNNQLLKLILSSDVLFKMLIIFPVTYCCYLAYRDFGDRRYNFAEFLTACIYMTCAFSIYNNLFIKPLTFMNVDVSYTIQVVMMLLVGTLALVKAFPGRSAWAHVKTWLKFMFFNLCWVFVGLIILAFFIL